MQQMRCTDVSAETFAATCDAQNMFNLNFFLTFRQDFYFDLNL